MMDWIRTTLPIQGSAYAGDVDALYAFIVWLSVFFFILVGGLTLLFAWKYRKRDGKDHPTPHITENLPLEITWTVVPLILVSAIFFWGFHDYLRGTVAPQDALEIQVVAKKWNWAFEYPDGTRSLNEIHIPIGKPVKFIMSSEDVIHDFFIPSMRVKRDVLPNRYTQVWFTPAVLGDQVVQCAQYCGKGHSDMTAHIFVDTEAKYKDWIENGSEEMRKMPLAELGKLLYESKGCSTCHTLDGARGNCPSWKGIYGGMNKMQDGRMMKVDENYIRHTIYEPNSMLLPGYEAIMPSFQGLLRPREELALIEFIKTVK